MFQGCPPSDASRMMENGMTVRAEVSKIGERKWRGVITCEEVPQMNDTHIYEEDKGTSFEDVLTERGCSVQKYRETIHNGTNYPLAKFRQAVRYCS